MRVACFVEGLLLSWVGYLEVFSTPFTIIALKKIVHKIRIFIIVNFRCGNGNV